MKNFEVWESLKKDNPVNMKTEIENDNHQVKEIAKKFTSALRDKKVHEDIIFDIYIGLEEALRNAMVHGNKMDPCKKILIETEIENSFAVMSVEDQGEGFDPGGLPDPTLDENLTKEGGRGVFLIYKLMDEVNYGNGGRKVIMKKYFDKKSFIDGGEDAD